MFFNLSFSVASFGLKLSYHVLYTERPKADLVFQKWKENGEIKGHRQSDLANEASRATFTLLFEVISAPLSHAKMTNETDGSHRSLKFVACRKSNPTNQLRLKILVECRALAHLPGFFSSGQRYPARRIRCEQARLILLTKRHREVC